MNTIFHHKPSRFLPICPSGCSSPSALYMAQAFSDNFMRARPSWNAFNEVHHYFPALPYFLLTLTLAILGYHLVQKPYTTYLNSKLATSVKKWREGFLYRCYYGGLLPKLNSALVRVVATLAFVAFYIAYVSNNSTNRNPTISREAF